MVEALVAEGHKFPAHVCERRNQKLLKILRAVGVDITAGRSFATGAEGVVALLEKVYAGMVELVLAAADPTFVEDVGQSSMKAENKKSQSKGGILLQLFPNAGKFHCTGHKWTLQHKLASLVEVSKKISTPAIDDTDSDSDSDGSLNVAE